MEQLNLSNCLTILGQRQSNPVIVCPNCGSEEYRKNGKNKSSGTQIYYCKRCGRDFTPLPATPGFAVNPKAEYEKDCWDCRRLGLDGGVGKSSYKLNFSQLTQPWLRQSAKKYIKVCLSRITFSSTQEKLYSLRRLSRFLSQNYPGIQPEEIDRDVITEYIVYTSGEGLSASTRHKLLCDAKLYFDACYQNQWLDVSRYLVRSEDFPKQPKSLPRYIPEHVMQQLNGCIDDLPEPVMRMVLVLQECGMRISELLHLKTDCLLQDQAGDWFLKYYQFKMKKEITIPISREVARVIQEQRRYIQSHIPRHLGFDYLFTANGGVKHPDFNPVPKVMERRTLPRYLNQLAKRHNICDETGEIWHFQTHQFRHTVGTRMINNGVPQHIVQRYLGHESPQMTATYARIHDQTMKEEVAKFRGKVVNIAGEIVEPNDVEADDADLQWVKKNVQAQALPNGSCALPAISQGCPHANACLTCTHFRTTAEYLGDHHRQLEQTQAIIAKAKSNGWQRQVEMNEKVKGNLESIIAGLTECKK
ncbi:tyrosine-type recombinase/integrase [Baaleninema simplex]|uniref:tyrosine-type recombinase/integrase n=1 Tax=Baaleninema simplex TaxID=2862350 RepID=UPI000376BBC6|nr:tyrosine-type recombinase/integrase [Baaleninema simplex]